MSTQSVLCTVQSSTASNCCTPASTAVQVPTVITNAPGLPAIRYRIGTFTSFRQAMLDDVAGTDLMLTAVVTALSADVGIADTTIQVQDYTSFPSSAPFRVKIGSEYMLVIAGAGTDIWTVQRGSDQSTPQLHLHDDSVFSDPANPFISWQPGSHADYHTMFIELWAYLADILTFYQERIANEAYLGTATQRDSLLRLAELIDNRPSPGAGASSVVAFSVQSGKTVAVPSGFAVASKSSPTNPAATFETSTAITAVADHNAMPAATSLPQDQFGHLSSTIRTVVLQGSSLNLSIGDYLLVVTNEGTSTEKALALRLQSVSTDKASNTTTVMWSEAAGSVYDHSTIPINLYVLPVTASVFGSNAPEYDSLPSTLTVGLASPPIVPIYTSNWDNPTQSVAYLPLASSPSDGASPVHGYIFLDAVYSTIKASPEFPGWAIVLSDSPGPTQIGQVLGSANFIIYHVTDAHAINVTGYALNNKVTRLALGSNETVQGSKFPIRKTTVLAGSQRVFAETSLPMASPISGSTITLSGLYPQLKAGQKVVVQGSAYTAANPAPVVSELAVLGSAPQLDPIGNTTTISLTRGLQNQYFAASTVVLGNVAEVTQGQTIRNEILGSGNGTAFQSFTLKKSPLTYLPSTDSEGLAAVVSTLLVTVSGVEWVEQPNLIDSAPNAQYYVTQTDNSGKTTVSFGDGFNGAAPPTGLDNIQAIYRKGLGSSGNLPIGAIQQISGNMPGLQKVTNPQPSSGGADPDSIDDIRVNAPASMTTFGRAISARDYAALALQFPSIQKATGAWIRVDSNTLRPVPQPYVQLTVATADGTPIANSVTARNLRAYLDNHRDANIPLRILDYSAVYIDVALTIDILPLYPRQGTLALVQAALNPGLNPDGSAGYFSLASSQFGQSIHLSAVYAVVQGIEGVQDVLITTLRRMDTDANTPLTIRNDIFVRPTELAVVGNDPSNPGRGFLTIQLGVGGFADA
jgi:predicted phage baseplate assembly protein